MASACGSRSVYLITYSRADKQKIPSKERFAEVISNEFTGVRQWVCCEELHADNESSHYHLAIKLDRVKRWKLVRQRIQNNYGICINFSDDHNNYYTAYRYVVKDGNYIKSPNHPEYSESPQTNRASRRRKPPSRTDGSNNGEPGPSSKRRSVDIVSLYELIVKENIKSDLQLCGQAKTELSDGKRDLANLILSKSEKARNDIIKTAWKIHTSHDEISRSSKSRIDILEECQTLDCTCIDDDEWFKSACEIIDSNDLRVVDIATAIYTNLEHGRCKKTNIMLVGPANCGKTFILRPLTLIFKTFVNPASTTFAWVGAEASEIVFLNDFRWSEKILPWSDLLNLCEGFPVHIAAPKTHFAEDILWTSDTPIFCTAKSTIQKFYEEGELNVGETTMMEARWTVFKFTKQITAPRDIKPCQRCFYEFISTYRIRNYRFGR